MSLAAKSRTWFSRMTDRMSRLGRAYLLPVPGDADDAIAAEEGAPECRGCERRADVANDSAWCRHCNDNAAADRRGEECSS